ncbi:MAG TPA: CPBP family intramembrane glutamic endopeptidase [Acidimicrobiales bacterium]|nr:CPBP family intramembrane glutamic endopeptidase [Acidimicrobiales bacterium]
MTEGIVLARPRSAVLAVVAGCSLLVLRPVLLRNGAHPTAALTMLFLLLLAGGLLWPRRAAVPTGVSAAAPVLAVGVAAFLLGRVLGGGHAPQPLLLRVVVLGSLAAVAEEAFFRRFVYDALLPGGAALAVVGSALLFALVHVTVYGWWVLPIDLAAGFVLSWQRWATGSWKVPAVTHVLANLLVVL